MSSPRTARGCLAGSSQRTRQSRPLRRQPRTHLVLGKGFRHQAFPKIEIHRSVLNKPLLCMQDENIIALVCDGPIAQATALPLLPLNEPRVVADFVLQWLSEHTDECNSLSAPLI